LTFYAPTSTDTRLFPALTLEEIESFKFKRKEFIDYVVNKLGEKCDS